MASAIFLGACRSNITAVDITPTLSAPTGAPSVRVVLFTHIEDNTPVGVRYLRDSLGVAIDPHSHESGGYNYTDVAHLLDSLGVGGTTVIGGHIWDPSLPLFAEWDRFRLPVRGSQYPLALWRGDILMGSGTPNHVNDPIISGVWRSKDRNKLLRR